MTGAFKEWLLGCFGFDVFDGIANGGHFLGIFIRDFDVEFFFERHNQFDRIQRVST